MHKAIKFIQNLKLQAITKINCLISKIKALQKKSLN